jgi:hypothetical protein
MDPDPGGPKKCGSGSGFGSGTLPVGRHAVRVDEGLEGARELVGAEEGGRGLRVRHLVQYRGCTEGITFGHVLEFPISIISPKMFSPWQVQ